MEKDGGIYIGQLLYCIVSIHLYSASSSARDPERGATGFVPMNHDDDSSDLTGAVMKPRRLSCNHNRRSRK